MAHDDPDTTEPTEIPDPNAGPKDGDLPVEQPGRDDEGQS